MTVRGFIASGLCLLAASAAQAQSVRDGFEAGALDRSKWTTSQIRPEQMRFEAPGRCGARAILILAREGDNGVDCPKEELCQRAEIRVAPSVRPRYGAETWFSFSFRIEGDVPETGSARTVIGQWKAPGDDSPFLAQRFDNGVFHITVQDNDTRRVVAKAEGDPDRMIEAQNLLTGIPPGDSRAVAGLRSLQSFHLLERSRPVLASRLFSSDLLGVLRDRPAAAPDRRELQAALGLPSAALVSRFSEIAFVAEPEHYLGPADIEIVPEAGRLLPDPRRGFVDMLYRVKPGRLDNAVGPRQRGEVEIWANGEKIVTVRGNLGYTLKAGIEEPLVGPYFKAGIYRKRIDGTLAFRFDEFAQAPARAGLPALCERP